ncbi:MAG: FtsX-like permease family protein [Deltaproteobacteria bacterium]|nr:FtsX-like permease family protein [Deltaproteobacteria bacterium]MBT4087922.1 FtsX-like permease family protein [Deltaproteobacteria bacterium]MBT4263314.1 FtsX-like permease family protein [Deltaproteobacteria bacterium]MBT4641546.1 FtsX-like permease family protein [Deltaproteobacteria bacterium]MBT6503382.1 FtsX-like permease family protein [Deltaproteobacteria bacterium]
METPTQSGSWLERQRSIIDYSLQSMFRRRTKNSLILVMYVLLIFVVSSVFFITGSLTVELFSTVDELPDITVQKLIGGRQVVIQESYFQAIREIPGVEAVEPRIWGYFYLEELQANFTIFGMDLTMLEEGEYQRIVDWGPALKKGEERPEFRMIIGEGVSRLLKAIQMEDSFLFFQPNWDTAIPFGIIGTFKSETQLQSNDLMVMQTEGARRVLELKEGEYTDLVVHVPNPEETKMIALKIRRYYPELRTVTRAQIESTYTSAFNWKAGFVLSSMLVVIFAFLVLIWDKASGLSPAEKKEIGILKAIGWDTEMILSVKFWESFIISLLASIFGVILSYFYIYWLHAPGLKEIFIGWSTIFPSFDLVPHIDLKFLLLIVTVTVIPYSTIAIFPAWKAAITDTDFILRNN